MCHKDSSDKFLAELNCPHKMNAQLRLRRVTGAYLPLKANPDNGAHHRVCVCVQKYACGHAENLHDGRIWAWVCVHVFTPSDRRLIKLLHSNELWLSVWQLLWEPLFTNSPSHSQRHKQNHTQRQKTHHKDPLLFLNYWKVVLMQRRVISDALKII